VVLARRLPNLRLAAPSAGPEPIVVRAAPVAEHVALADAHQHAAARQALQCRRAVDERVDEWVVLAGGGGAHDAPQDARALVLAAARTDRHAKKRIAGRSRGLERKGKTIRFHNQWYPGNFCKFGFVGICKIWGPKRFFLNELEKSIDFRKFILLLYPFS
jgi:hypothetical protein